MAKVLRVQGGVEEALKKLLKGLLESGRVKGILALRGTGSNGAVNYSLVTDPSVLEGVRPFHPLMPVQGARVLSRLTATEALEEPVAVLVRPCELRAFVELVKRTQGSFDNLLTISCTCPGVYPFSLSLDNGVGAMLDAYGEAVIRNEVPDGIRPACASCIEFVPYGADMTVLLVGGREAGKKTEILLNTPAAEEAAGTLGKDVAERDADSHAIDEMRRKRQANRKELFEEVAGAHHGLGGLTELFGRCIGCRGCREVCPVCYCTLCEFVSHRSELTVDSLEAELHKRGGLRVPPGTLTYHLGRMVHVSVSCVGCGQCTDVCPVDIPVSTFFSKVGESVQKMFDYVSGRDVEEPIPLTTFRTEELAEVED